MKNYFLTLFMAAVIGAAVAVVADGKFEKQTRYLISLICVLVIITPLKNSVEVFKDLSFPLNNGEQSGQEQSDYGAWIVDRSVKELENTVSQAITRKFGITVMMVQIVTYIEEGTTYVKKITVTLFPDQEAYAQSVGEYIEGLLYTETEVFIQSEDG